jgi:hypothetical protein
MLCHGSRFPARKSPRLCGHGGGAGRVGVIRNVHFCFVLSCGRCGYRWRRGIHVAAPSVSSRYGSPHGHVERFAVMRAVWSHPARSCNMLIRRRTNSTASWTASLLAVRPFLILALNNFWPMGWVCVLLYTSEFHYGCEFWRHWWLLLMFSKYFHLSRDLELEWKGTYFCDYFSPLNYILKPVFFCLDLPAIARFLQSSRSKGKLIKCVEYTRWFKYDRDKPWLVYTQIVPVIFEPPCIFVDASLPDMFVN